MRGQFSAAADMERAEGLAGQALAVSPSSSFAHMCKGQLLGAGPVPGGHSRIRTALGLDRNRVGELTDLGWCKLSTGSIEEAIPLVEQAIRLDPRNPDIGTDYCGLGSCICCNRTPTKQSFGSKKARSANPAPPFYHLFPALAYGLKGESERAAAELAEARRLSRDDRFSSLGHMKAAGFWHGSSGYWGVPKIRALFEATYFAGLRKAGMPEE
jgi:tetratricopeptide (TPR) repeat protein